MHKYTGFMHKQTGVMYKQEWLIYAVCGTFLYILTKSTMHKIDYVVHKWYDIHAHGGGGRDDVYIEKLIPTQAGGL